MAAHSKPAAAVASLLLFAFAYAPRFGVHGFVHSAHPLHSLSSRRASQKLPSTQSLDSYARSVHNPLNLWNPLDMFATASGAEDIEKEVSKMKATEIRDELQSYGISTKSFFEKKELVDALVQARKEGKTPIANGSSTEQRSSTAANKKAADRHDRIHAELEKCKGMKVKDLKLELESYGVDTSSYFEKSEFERAVAEARVDGAKKTGQSSRSTGFGRNAGRKTKEEPYDPSYREVVVRKLADDMKAGLLLDGSVIDVQARSAFQ